MNDGRKTVDPDGSPRVRILEAAFAIASERGYNGTTLALVAEQARLPVGSIYWQFKSKDELLAASVQHGYDEWRRTTEWMKPSAQSPRDSRFDTAVANLIRALAEYPAFPRLGLVLGLEQRDLETQSRATFRRIRSDTVEALTDWWSDSLPEPTSSELAEELAFATIALADGLYVARQAEDLTDESAVLKQIELMVRTFADGN